MLILHSAKSNRRDNAPNGIGKSGEFLGGIGGAAAGKQVPLSALSQRQLLIDYLTDHPTSDLFALSKSLGTSLSRTESLIQQLADEGIVVVEAGQGNRLYKLKA